MRKSLFFEMLCMLIFVLIGTIPLSILNVNTAFFLAWGAFVGIILYNICEFICDKLSK